METEEACVICEWKACPGVGTLITIAHEKYCSDTADCRTLLSQQTASGSQNKSLHIRHLLLHRHLDV
jgi:hypothetical protein